MPAVRLIATLEAGGYGIVATYAGIAEEGDVRFGSKAYIPRDLSHVCFTPESGHYRATVVGQLSANQRDARAHDFDCRRPGRISRPMSVALNSELKEREVSSSLSFALLAGKLTLRLTLQPIIDVLAHHILGQAIALLDDSFELLAPSIDHGQIVLGKLTPLLFDPALCLFPISFDPVPVHSRHLRKSGPPREGETLRRAGSSGLKKMCGRVR